MTSIEYLCFTHAFSQVAKVGGEWAPAVFMDVHFQEKMHWVDLPVASMNSTSSFLCWFLCILERSHCRWFQGVLEC